MDTSTTIQLQTSRDSTVAALFLAQQRAMAQMDPVRVVTNGGQVDIEQDSGSGYQSIRVGNVQYPVDISPATITSATLGYDRLGRTTAASLVVSHGGASATVTVSASGYAQ